MALSARELLLVVRAQNQASGALRRVARDVRGLPDRRALEARRAQASIGIEQLRRQRQITLNELQSITTGTRRLANERQIVQAQNAQFRNQAAQVRNVRSQLDAETRLVNQGRIRQDIAFKIAQAEANRARLISRQFGGSEAAFLASAQRAPVGRAAITENQLRSLRQAAAVNAGISTSAGIDMQQQINNARILRNNAQELNLRYQQAAARARDLDARAGVLNHTLGIQAERIALAEQKWRDYDAAIRTIKWDRLSSAGRILQHLGRVGQYAGLVIGGAFAYAAHTAAQFQSQVTLAATQVANRAGQGANSVVAATRQISAGVLQVLRVSEDSSQAINAAAYDIFSSMTLRGNQRSQITQGIAILQQFNRAAIAGQADIADVTHAGITLLNNFAQQGRQVQQLPGLLNRMFAAVRFGRMTVSQFTGTLNQLAPAFSAAFGRSPRTFNQLAGALAALSRQMPSLRMASTGLARLTEMFGRRDFVRGLRTFGVNITDAEGRLIPFEQIIQRLVRRFPQLQRGGTFLQNFFKTITAAGSTTGTGGTMGTIQGRRALQLLILNRRQYHNINRQVITDNNEFIKSFRAMRNTPDVQWRIFMNTLRRMAIVIGTEAIPAIISVGRPVVRLIKWFNDLDQGTKRQIATWGVYVAAFSLVGSAFSFVIGTGLRFISMLGRFVETTIVSQRALATLGAEAGFISARFALGLGLLALIPLFIRFHTQIMHIVNALGGLKAVVIFLTLYLAVRTVRAYSTVAAAAWSSARAQIAANTAAAASAGFSAGKLAGLLVTLRTLSAQIWPIAVLVTITEIFSHAKGITNFLKNNVPGFKALGDFADRHSAFLRNLDRRHGLLSPGIAVAPRGPRGLTPEQIVEGQTAVRQTRRLGMTARRAQVVYALMRRFGIRTYQGQRTLDLIQERLQQQHHRAQIRRIQQQAAAQQHLSNSARHYIALAEQANRYARQHPHDLQAQVRAAQIMDQIQKRFKGAELAGIQAVISADDNAAKKRIANSKKVADAATKNVQEAVQNMRSIYDSLLQQNQQALGDITQGVRIQNQLQFGNVPRPTEILADARDMLRRFTRWRRELTALERRGLPFALAQQLEQAGPDVEPLLRGIMQMNRGQFRRFTGLFRQGQRAVRAATMFDFNQQLRDWRSHGRNAAIAFMRGVRDESSYINRMMRRIFLGFARGQGNPQLTQGTTHHHVHHHNHDESLTVNNPKEDLRTTQRKHDFVKKHRRRHRVR